MKILNRWNGSVLFEAECETKKQAVEKAVSSGADLSDADLSGADLSDADLSGAVLSDADLSGADLSGADLSDAVLRHVKGIPPIPIVPDLDKKVLAAVENGGKLQMDRWHSCETTHCRGGWAITLAGEAGKTLEAAVGSQPAAMLIYLHSTGRVPNFYADNETAMKDIRECAKC